MAKPPNLSDLQELTMLAVARLRDQAFGSAIQDELREVASREVSVSTIYVTLVRLENEGLVESRRTLPDPGKGGKGKRFFRLTPDGWAALEMSRNTLVRMWAGVTPA